MDITTTLSDDEATALRTVEANPQAWAQSTVRGRATAVLDSIVNAEIAYLLRNDEPLPSTRSAILASATESGRAIPAIDMAQVNLAAIAQDAPDTPQRAASDPLDAASHPEIKDQSADA